MRYAGWNLEKTLLISERSGIERRREPIDVCLAVASERAANLPRDVRAVLKPDWNAVDREIPSQVHRVAHHGATTTFRVAFNIDLPAGGTQRVGVYYDNPDAAEPNYPTDLDVTGSGLGYTVATPFYEVQTDPASGQINTIIGKIDDQGSIGRRLLTLPDAAQEGNVVVLAGDNGGPPVAVSAAGWAGPRIVAESRGPIFFKQTRRGRLVPPGQDERGDWPELEITYKFFAEQPYFLVHSRLTFPRDTRVFGVYNDVLTLNRQQFSHYTFRPVSPNLPETDVEEMGHILVDPAWTGDLPDGLAFSGFLPYSQAWHAFINIHAHKEQAICSIQLDSRIESPGGLPVTYRPATYLLRSGQSVQWFRSPIYVHARGPGNAITVPAGTVFEECNVLSFSIWDPQWGQRVDALGKRLNNPVTITNHPTYVGGPVPPEPFEPLPRGTRADAYRLAGVR